MKHAKKCIERTVLILSLVRSQPTLYVILLSLLWWGGCEQELNGGLLESTENSSPFEEVDTSSIGTIANLIMEECLNGDDDALEYENEYSYLLALEQLEKRKRYKEENWGVNARITDRFPLYLPGIAEPSYYEYKVSECGEDAGYILVNTNQTDIMIPEMTLAGPTLTDRYKKKLGKDASFKIFRYNLVESAAKVEDMYGQEQFKAFYGFVSEDRVTLVGEPGFDSTFVDSIYQKDGRYKEVVARKGNVPWHAKGEMNGFYKHRDNPTIEAMMSRIEMLKDPNQRVPKSVEGPYFLKHMFKEGNVRTPRWHQFSRNDGRVGCGAVAWALVLAYWHQFKSRTMLFSHVDLDKPEYRGGNFLNTFVEDIIWELADDWLNTIIMDGQSATLPFSMRRGLDFAEDRGYPVTGSNYEEDSAGPTSQWEAVTAAIHFDKPSILLIDSDEGSLGFGDHYVVVEGTEREIWDNHIVLSYYVNFGWGNQNLRIINDIFYDGDNQHRILDALLIHNIPSNYPAPPYALLSFDAYDGPDGPLGGTHSLYWILEDLTVPDGKILTKRNTTMEIAIETGKTISAEGNGRMHFIGTEREVRFIPKAL